MGLENCIGFTEEEILKEKKYCKSESINDTVLNVVCDSKIQQFYFSEQKYCYMVRHFLNETERKELLKEVVKPHNNSFSGSVPIDNKEYTIDVYEQMYFNYGISNKPESINGQWLYSVWVLRNI